MTYSLHLRTEWKTPHSYRFDVVKGGTTLFAWVFDRDLSYQSKEHHVYRAVLPDSRLFCDETDSGEFQKCVVTQDQLRSLIDAGMSWSEVEVVYEDIPSETAALIRLMEGAA